MCEKVPFCISLAKSSNMTKVWIGWALNNAVFLADFKIDERVEINKKNPGKKN
jgi:hypothetical protein